MINLSDDPNVEYDNEALTREYCNEDVEMTRKFLETIKPTEIIEGVTQ